jgi:hypothetical protein
MAFIGFAFTLPVLALLPYYQSLIETPDCLFDGADRMMRNRCLLAGLSLLGLFAAGFAAPAGAQPALQPQPAQPARAPAPAKPAVSAPKPPAAKPVPMAAPGGGSPTLLGQFGDWGAYTANPGGNKKVCFALAKPAKAQTTPPNRPRDPSYMFISTRPSEKVKDEVSVIVGYALKPSSDASLDIGGTQFAMYTQNDGAWIKNAAEEGRLVDALRKGSDAVIKGTSSKGTVSSDTYSLRGLAQALDRVGQECQ